MAPPAADGDPIADPGQLADLPPASPRALSVLVYRDLGCGGPDPTPPAPRSHLSGLVLPEQPICARTGPLHGPVVTLSLAASANTAARAVPPARSTPRGNHPAVPPGRTFRLRWTAERADRPGVRDRLDAHRVTRRSAIPLHHARGPGWRLRIAVLRAMGPPTPVQHERALCRSRPSSRLDSSSHPGRPGPRSCWAASGPGRARSRGPAWPTLLARHITADGLPAEMFGHMWQAIRPSPPPRGRDPRPPAAASCASTPHPAPLSMRRQ